MDKQKVGAKEGSKQASPGQLTQLTRNWAEFFGRLTASEDSRDKAQWLIQRFDMLDVVADGFFAEGRHLLITLWHGRLRVDYSKTLATLMRRNGVLLSELGHDSWSGDVTSFPVCENRKGVWECGLDVVALFGVAKCSGIVEKQETLGKFGIKFADAHQAYEFAGVCPADALPKCRIAVGGTLNPDRSDYHLSLFNRDSGEVAATRWRARNTWGFTTIEPTLQKRIFLLAVRDEKPVE